MFIYLAALLLLSMVGPVGGLLYVLFFTQRLKPLRQEGKKFHEAFAILSVLSAFVVQKKLNRITGRRSE